MFIDQLPDISLCLVLIADDLFLVLFSHTSYFSFVLKLKLMHLSLKRLLLEFYESVQLLNLKGLLGQFVL